MRFLIDTDHASLIQQKAEPEYTAISRHLAAWTGEIVYSIISVHEQFCGSHSYINQARSTGNLIAGYRRFAAIVDFYNQISLVHFDDHAGAEVVRLKVSGLKLKAMDLRIAAIALSRGSCGGDPERPRLQQSARLGDRRLDDSSPVRFNPRFSG